MMYKHKEVLEYPVDNIDYAIHSAKKFLKCYKKENIVIGEATITDNRHTKVEVEFSDNYDDVCFPTKDYVPDDGNDYHM